jgi:hypothetical protein
MLSPRNNNLRNFAALLGLLAIMVISTMALPGPSSRVGIQEDPVAALPAPPLLRTSVEVPIPTERVAVPVVDFLKVQVCDAQGRAVAAAKVRYYLEEVIGFPQEVAGTTDATGLFLSPALPAGTYRIRSEAPGLVASKVLEFQIPAPADQKLDIVLHANSR